MPTLVIKILPAAATTGYSTAEWARRWTDVSGALAYELNGQKLQKELGTHAARATLLTQAQQLVNTLPMVAPDLDEKKPEASTFLCFLYDYWVSIPKIATMTKDVITAYLTAAKSAIESEGELLNRWANDPAAMTDPAAFVTTQLQAMGADTHKNNVQACLDILHRLNPNLPIKIAANAEPSADEIYQMAQTKMAATRAAHVQHENILAQAIEKLGLTAAEAAHYVTNYELLETLEWRCGEDHKAEKQLQAMFRFARDSGLQNALASIHHSAASNLNHGFFLATILEYPDKSNLPAAEKTAVYFAKHLHTRGFWKGPCASMGVELLSHFAALGNSDVIQDLLTADKALAEGFNIYSLRDQSNNTALHHAARKGHLGTVMLLKQAGASIDALNAAHLTPLETAVLRGGVDVIEALQEGTPIKDRYDALKTAARNGRGQIVRALLIGLKDSDTADKAVALKLSLLMAAARGFQYITKLVLDASADINARAPYSDNKTALHLVTANTQEFLSATKILLQRGADPNLADTNGRTPLHEAAKRGHLRSSRLLLRHGANPNAVAQGLTPLDEVILAKRTATITELLRCPHLQQETLNRGLLTAMRTYDVGLCQNMLAAGASIYHAQGGAFSAHMQMQLGMIIVKDIHALIYAKHQELNPPPPPAAAPQESWASRLRKRPHAAAESHVSTEQGKKSRAAVEQAL
jgi:ankyrin repeat protein